MSTMSLLISHCLWVHPRFTWSRKDVGSPKSTSLLSTFHIGSMFCFFPANLMSSSFSDKNNPFSRCTNKHSQLETVSNRVPIELSQIAFPTKVLPKDDRTDFAWEERPDLPCWTVIYAICVVVDVSKCLEIPTLAVWIWYPWLLLFSFSMLMNFVQWMLHKIQNHLLECHLGVPLDLWIFGALYPIRHSSNERCPSMMRSVLFCPLFLLHQLGQICHWLWYGSAWWVRCFVVSGSFCVPVRRGCMPKGQSTCQTGCKSATPFEAVRDLDLGVDDQFDARRFEVVVDGLPRSAVGSGHDICLPLRKEAGHDAASGPSGMTTDHLRPLLRSFVMLMNLVQWMLHKIQNHLLECHLGVQLAYPQYNPKLKTRPLGRE